MQLYRSNYKFYNAMCVIWKGRKENAINAIHIYLEFCSRSFQKWRSDKLGNIEFEIANLIKQKMDVM